MKKKILVAGGTGYIGSHTTVELQNAGYEVVIIDDLSNSNIEVLDGIEKITGIRPEFIQLDLKDKEGTRKALEAHPGIKGIILFAASKAVGESVQQPLKYYRNNIVTLVNLLETMPEVQYRRYRILFLCTVYGQPDPENLPVTRRMPRSNPLCLLMETRSRSTRRLSGIRSMRERLSRVSSCATSTR